MSTEDRKRVAALRLRARRHRDGELRRRAVVLSLVMFALLWAAVFAQMVSGHDPVLGTGTKAASVVRQDTRRAQKRPSRVASDEQGVTIDPQTGMTEGSGTASGAANGSAASAAPAPAPVTTSQS
jgi:hypothetical protein